MRGSGKNTVAKILAQRLNLKLVDTDRLIEEEAEKSISDIIKDKGLNAFRNLETKILSGVKKINNACLATGGGIIEKKYNKKLLSRLGFIIYLRITPELAFKRIGNDPNRPLLTDETNMLQDLKKLYLKRKPVYEKLARLTINCDNKKNDLIINEIINKIRL